MFQAATGRSSSLRLGLGITFSRSTPITRPKPWQVGHAPSGELKAKSGGVALMSSSRADAPVRVPASVLDSSEPDIENAASAAAAISGRDSSRTMKRPTTTRRFPSASRSSATLAGSSGISTVSPDGESARKKPARFSSAIRRASSRSFWRRPRRFFSPPLPFQSTGAARTTREPSSDAASSSTARSTPPGTAARPQSGQNVVPPWAKRRRSES